MRLDSENKERLKHSLAKIASASMTGYALGSGVALAERLILGNKRGSFASHVANKGFEFMLFSGTYAAAEAAMQAWRGRDMYVPIVAGCISGAVISRNSGAGRVLMMSSLVGAASGISEWNAVRKIAEMDESKREEK